MARLHRKAYGQEVAWCVLHLNHAMKILYWEIVRRILYYGKQGS